MAWPFSHVVQPSYDSGFVAVPDTPTTQEPSSLWLLGAHFNNPTTSPITVSLTDNSDNKIITELLIPAKSISPRLEFAFMPCAGLKWTASGIGIIGKLWGYK